MTANRFFRCSDSNPPAMHFLALIFKNLLRRPARSLLTVAGLAVSVATVVALVGVATGFENSVLSHYTDRGIDLVVQRASTGMETLNNGLPEQLGAELAKLPGVKQATGRLLDQISFEEAGILVSIVSGWAPGSSLFGRLTMMSGRQLVPGDERKAMIGRLLAAQLGKATGDTIDLYGERFEIVGVYESPTRFENDGSVVLLPELQRLMHRPNEVTGYCVAARRPIDEDQLERLRQSIEALRPRVAATRVADFVQNFNLIRISHAVAWSISSIALVIGAIGMLNTMFMSVFERTKEIGLLRAIGWRRSRIVRMVLGESLVLSLAGAVIGLVVGVPCVKLLSAMPNVAGLSEGTVAAGVMLESLVAAVVVGCLGAIYPALWGAGLLPTEALRR